MILILARDADEHIPLVARNLEARSVEYCRFDVSLFPCQASLSIRYEADGKPQRKLKFGKTSLDLNRVRAVWDRAILRPLASDRLQDSDRWAASEICSRVMVDLWECLACFWLPNRPDAAAEIQAFASRRTAPEEPFHPPLGELRAVPPTAGNKLYQLQLAGRLGFTVPKTLVTNDPEDFLEFYEQSGGELICKQPVRVELTRDGQQVDAFTSAVRRRSAAACESIRFAPVIFQQRIPKKLELRVTVVGTSVFAAAIQSQASPRLEVDWRHHQDFGRERLYSVYDLPQEVERRCVQIVQSLGLCYGAIDLIVTPENDYVFLEVNPNGQWAWVEIYTGMPIAAAIASLLIDASRPSAQP